MGTLRGIHCYAGGMGKRDRAIEVIARGALIVDRWVLLCRSVEHEYSYLPGGHVDFGEAAAEAVEREFDEETGMRVRAGELLLVTEAAFSTRGKDHHEINLVFHVEPENPTVLKHGGDTPPPPVTSREPKIAFDWVELAAMPETDVRPEAVRAWLAALGNSASPKDGAEWVSEIALGWRDESKTLPPQG